MKIKVDPLDVLFSQVVRARANYTCEYCGQSGKKMECSHFHSRRKRSVRYDLGNCACLCFSCHTYLGGNPYVHTEWFKKRLGSKRFEQLNIRAETLVRYSKTERDELKVQLQAQLKPYEEAREVDAAD